jgi:SNF2 family DNA or RNA helicase
MEATNTDFHAYQFKRVVKILNSASKGLLIADEAGLGKTIEAGLVWTELAARYDVQRLLVVCPKSLQEKWRVELRGNSGWRPRRSTPANCSQC